MVILFTVLGILKRFCHLGGKVSLEEWQTLNELEPMSVELYAMNVLYTDASNTFIRSIDVEDAGDAKVVGTMMNPGVGKLGWFLGPNVKTTDRRTQNELINRS